MDELTLDGKLYISSKRAAQITGYAKDYVGQLCREGRVEARLVGRNWYILEDSIRAHRFGAPGVSTSDVQEDADESASEPLPESASEPLPETVAEGQEGQDEEENEGLGWKPATYIQESAPELPNFAASAPVEAESVPTPTIPVAPIDQAVVDQMHSVWEDWFKTRAESVPVPAEQETSAISESFESDSFEAESVEMEEEVPVAVTRISGVSAIFTDSEAVSHPESTAEEDSVIEQVPLHRTYSAPQAAQRVSTPRSERSYAYTYTKPIEPVGANMTARQERALAQFEEGRVLRERRVQKKRKASGAWRAIFIGIALAAVLVGVAGTGIAEQKIAGIGLRIPVLTNAIEYVSGQRTVEK